MSKYESFKKWLELNRPKILLILSFALVFILGFGSGRYDRDNFSRRAAGFRMQNNYTTKNETKQKNNQDAGNKATLNIKGAAIKNDECLIKGNISTQGKKIFHVKGGSFYERTNPEQCFNTEAEAVAAGYIKSSR